jgi:AraC-like DNA-binding protein
MIGAVEDIKIVSTIKKESKPYKKVLSRKLHGFVYRIKGKVEYYTNGEVITVNAGELVFLPKGSEYVINSYDSTYTSINFEAKIENPRITLYSLNDYSSARGMFLSFPDIWNFGNQSERYKCLSEFYDLLSYISRIEHLSEVERGNYRILTPALEFLKGHIFDYDLRVSALHEKCGISDTYFRKIFVSRFGMTPQEYVLKERLTRARLIIEGGDYDSIRAVSESVGYNDPLYFSKAFRKHYGVPPSELGEL